MSEPVRHWGFFMCFFWLEIYNYLIYSRFLLILCVG